MFERVDKKSAVSQAFIDTYLPYFREQSYPAKTVLLDEGTVTNKIFWIKKRCMRIWLNKDGQEITFQFFLENSNFFNVRLTMSIIVVPLFNPHEKKAISNNLK